MPPARALLSPDRASSSSVDEAIETRFFRHLRLPNGTYKTTYPNRMPEVDTVVAGALAPAAHADVLDVGVSSGVTTLELMDTLEVHGTKATVIAVDLSVRAFVRRVAGVDLLCDPGGRVLQIATPLGAKGRPHDPERSRSRTALQHAFRAAERIVGGPAGAARGTPVQLISPRLARRSEVTVCEHDLATERPEWRDRFDVVRAANILNRDYFDEPALARMIAHLSTYVRPHGLFVLCRTHDDSRINHASVLRRVDAGNFAVVARVGAGSEVESLVAEARPPR